MMGRKEMGSSCRVKRDHKRVVFILRGGEITVFFMLVAKISKNDKLMQFIEKVGRLPRVIILVK